ncbi:MAG: tetratricopeptide repeat protein [bacterium]
MNYFNEAEKIFLKHHDEFGVIKVYSNFGCVYMEMNNYEQSMEYLTKARDLEQKTGNDK